MRKSLKSQFDIFLSLFTVTAIVSVDRVTKIFFMDFLNPNESYVVIQNFLYMTLVHNTGIAFGMFKNQGGIFIFISIILIILLLYNIIYYKRHQENLSRLYIVAFSMILAGAIGNLIDRILFGYVIDFIDFRVWPVFNIADSAITIGAVIIVVKFFPRSTERKDFFLS